MEAIGIILLAILLFIILGICGWIFKALGYIFEFLFDGCLNSIGCLFWVFIIIVILIGLSV